MRRPAEVTPVWHICPKYLGHSMYILAGFCPIFGMGEVKKGQKSPKNPHIFKGFPRKIEKKSRKINIQFKTSIISIEMYLFFQLGTPKRSNFIVFSIIFVKLFVTRRRK